MKRVRIVDIIPPLLHEDIMAAELFQDYWHMLLYESYSHKGMILGFHDSEVRPMAMALRGLSDRSRASFVMVKEFLSVLGGQIDAVQLVGDLDGGPLEMNVKLRKGRGTHDLLLGPAEGICLALEMPAPIYISNEMLRRFGFELPVDLRGAFSKEKGIESIVKKVREDQRNYEGRLHDLNSKAARKTDAAYAVSSKKVFDFLFVG